MLTIMCDINDYADLLRLPMHESLLTTIRGCDLFIKRNDCPSYTHSRQQYVITANHSYMHRVMEENTQESSTY